MKPGWWYRATTEQRLAQIDAAIELGMTARQCAINCGCLDESKIARDQPGALQDFAFRNGRHFNGFSANKNANLWSERRNGRLLNKRTASIVDDRAAYLSGEPVDFWTTPWASLSFTKTRGAVARYFVLALSPASREGWASGVLNTGQPSRICSGFSPDGLAARSKPASNLRAASPMVSKTHPFPPVSPAKLPCWTDTN